jgi:putative membrane protein
MQSFSILETELINTVAQTQMLNAIAAIMDAHSSLVRIKTPIPLAYWIHLRHVVALFLLALPFQIVRDLWWGTIPVVLIAAFVMFGIEGIANEVSEPFGYHLNDLALGYVVKVTSVFNLRH